MLELNLKFVLAMIAAASLSILVIIYQITALSFENTQTEVEDIGLELNSHQQELDHGIFQVSTNTNEPKIISMPRCPIYSFVKNITKSNELTIQFWNRAWYHQGFAPYVLTEKDALSRPEYGMLMSKIPSSDLHSGYLRWLAMASVQGGLYVDINIIPMQGHGKLFPKYADACRPEGPLTIYENYGHKIFQTNATSLHKFIDQLSHEKNLRGKDEEWLIANKSEYQINLGEEKIAAINVMNNAYFQRQRRFSHHLQFTPETLKTYLARVNFMNTHRIKIIKHSDESENYSSSAIESSIERSLECPFPISIGFDVKNIFPNDNFTCEVRYLTSLSNDSRTELGENEVSSTTLNEIYFIYVKNPKFSNSPKISALFPGTNCKKQIQKLCQSTKHIFVLVDEDYRDVKFFLEFKLGFPIDIVPDYASDDRTIKEDHASIGDNNDEMVLYGIIKKRFSEELKQIKEFA